MNDLDVVLLTSPGGASVFIGNYFTDDDDRNGTQDDVDCGGFDDATPDGVVDQSEWSLDLTRCVGAGAGSPRDTENPTEAIFLSPDPDNDPATSDSQIVAGTWTIEVAGNASNVGQPALRRRRFGRCLPRFLGSPELDELRLQRDRLDHRVGIR